MGRNMVTGKKMQNPYGSTESERVDGTAVSSFVSWDSKITTVAALLGGVSDLVKARMVKEKIYQDFIRVTKVGSGSDLLPVMQLLTGCDSARARKGVQRP